MPRCSETDRAAASTDVIGATAASDRADRRLRQIGTVRKAQCACAACAHPPEGMFLVFSARVALARVDGGRVWHGRVRARSAVQENQGSSCESLCGTRSVGSRWSGPIFAFFCRVSSFCRTLQGFVSVLHSLLAPFAFLPGCNDLSNRCLSFKPIAGAHKYESSLSPPPSSLPLPLLL